MPGRPTLCGLAVLLCLRPAQAPAEASRSGPDEEWAFVEAWAAFRRDLDATVPGEHGQVHLVEGLGAGPEWIARDAIRNAASATTLTTLARRVARERDRGAIPALRAALDRARDDASRRAIERALVRLGDGEIVRQEAQRLGSASAAERWQAAATLAAAGDEAGPALRSALEDPDGQTRIAAASALASRGDRHALALLDGLLRSANEFERREAAHGLALAGEERASAALREIVSQPGGDRARAARSLGLIGGQADQRLLLRLLGDLPRDRSQGLRREILAAVGRIAVRTELPAAQRHLRTLDDESRDEWGEADAGLEAVGRAVAARAAGPRAIAAHVAAQLASPLPAETPAAFAQRQTLVEPMARALSGGLPPSLPARDRSAFDLGAATRLIATRGGDAAARIARFAAAVDVLVVIGARLGHPALAEPPAARATGLGADRAIDGNLLTSWVAGPMAGPLRIELEAASRPRRLWLVGGCVEDRASYAAHGRVRGIEVRLDSGAPVVAELSDSRPYFQQVTLPSRHTRSLTISVSSVHPGQRSGAPACIAELRIE
jgi:HEAT repeat protein